MPMYQKVTLGSSRVARRVMDRRCHCCGSGGCCDAGSISRLGTSACVRATKKKKKSELKTAVFVVCPVAIVGGRMNSLARTRHDINCVNLGIPHMRYMLFEQHLKWTLNNRKMKGKECNGTMLNISHFKCLKCGMTLHGNWKKPHRGKWEKRLWQIESIYVLVPFGYILPAC